MMRPRRSYSRYFPNGARCDEKGRYPIDTVGPGVNRCRWGGSKHPLGRGYAGTARVWFDSLAQGSGDGLEDALDDMVHVSAVVQHHMQGHGRAGGDGAPELLGQFRGEGAEVLAGYVGLPDTQGPTAEVDRCRDQRLVHGHGGGAVTADPVLVGQGLLESLAEADTNVLHGVMGVDVQVALGPDGQVDQAVSGQQRQHVVEEADAGGRGRGTGSIEVEVQLDGRLARLSA